MIIQLNPVIAVETPLGKGDAIIYEDDGHEIYWTVALYETRAIVMFKNNKLRYARSYSSGHGITDEEMKVRIA